MLRKLRSIALRRFLRAPWSNPVSVQEQINGDNGEIVPRCSKMKCVRWNAMFQIWNECVDAAVGISRR
jgi:hypothetical protein